MTMNVDNKEKFFPVFLFHFQNIVSQVVNFREDELGLDRELSIKILSRKASPCVSNDHTIRIEHGYDFEHNTKYE